MTKNPYLTGVCNVFVMLLPVSLISAFCMLGSNAANMMGREILGERLMETSSLTWQLFPILLIVYYSQFLAAMHKLDRIAVITPSMVIYFIISYQWELLKVGTVIPTNYPLAILVPIAVALILSRTRATKVLTTTELPNVVENSINMVASFCTLVFTFAAFSYFLNHVIFDGIELSAYLPELNPNSLFDSLVYEVARNLLWSMGINGHIILAAYKTDLYHFSIAASEAYKAYGTPLPVLVSNFYDIYAGIGGAGNTLCLAITMFLFSEKGSSYRKLALAVLPLSIFNINEPIIYGLPIMFNPVLIIPFLLVPAISLVIAYFATSVGLVPPVSEVMSWMMPVFFSGYLGTEGSWAAVVLQSVLIVVGVSIYLPFFRKMEQITHSHGLFGATCSENVYARPQIELDTKPMATYIPQLSSSISAQKKLKALQREGEFVLFYQPQVNSKTHDIEGVEVLIRHRGHDGKITPPYFLDYFVSLGLMRELDLWVLNKGLKEVAPLAECENFKVSINISPDTLLIDSFVSQVLALIESSALNVSQVELEITEDVLVKDEKATREVVGELRRHGVSIALDDFGVGYSSLGYLSKFEFDKVKIDRSFVLNLKSEKGQEIFRLTSQLVGLGSNQIVIEGVEEQRELDFITDLDIDLVQGFYFYRPMPFASLFDLFKTAPRQAEAI
ncbi:EAL domain-containing protein [Vibrio sp. RE86]|uniref:EAL domain-containing protein n=1 Tax=Vibrio sp. RE86 TaxID=2607605 RepID=UPI003461D2A9